MASIRSYRTTKGRRRYKVRYHDRAGKQRSRAFSTHRDAQAFKLDVEHKRQLGKPRSHKAEGCRLFNEAEITRWLEQRRKGIRSNLSEGP
jgi:hypothetical protein